MLLFKDTLFVVLLNSINLVLFQSNRVSIILFSVVAVIKTLLEESVFLFSSFSGLLFSKNSSNDFKDSSLISVSKFSIINIWLNK